MNSNNREYYTTEKIEYILNNDKFYTDSYNNEK